MSLKRYDREAQGTQKQKYTRLTRTLFCLNLERNTLNLPTILRVLSNTSSISSFPTV